MDNLYNAVDYATAKRILKDLKESYVILTETNRKLLPYMKYKVVLESMKSLGQWYPVLQTQINAYQNVIDTKGKVVQFPLKKENQ